LPILPTLKADAATRVLRTPDFAVEVSSICSGLEGVGLMLAFCLAERGMTDVAVFDAIKRVQDGSFKGGTDVIATVENGGVGLGQIGPAGTKYESLLRFAEGKIKKMHAIDGSATYRGWADLASTIRAVVDHERGAAPTVQINVGETDPKINPEDHPDHQMTAKIGKITNYQGAFDKAFGKGPITIQKVEMAIASFERTLLSGNSPFDRYQYGGDKNAMSPSAIRGLALFKDKNKGNCVTCHTIEEKSALFSDGKFHNLGTGLDSEGNLKDQGRYNETHLDADRGAFRTPTLRNVAKTAPYMHDGSEKTLKDVVDFYVGGGSSNPHLDKEIKELKLSGTERADLVAFLESLTGDIPPNAGPPTK